MLKLDEQRKLEKAEREALLRSDDEEEEEDDTLGGFIVLSDSEGESSNSRSTSRSASTTGNVGGWEVFGVWWQGDCNPEIVHYRR